MSKVIEAFGTDNVVKNRFYKKIMNLFRNDDNLVQMGFEFFTETTSGYNDYNYFDLEGLFTSVNSSVQPYFEKKFHEDYLGILNQQREKERIVFDIVRQNEINLMYNFGKTLKNPKIALYKSVKKLFKDREIQKKIIDMFYSDEVSADELSAFIYESLKNQGLSFREIQMKIKDINQIMRLRRARDLSQGKSSNKKKINSLNVYLNKEVRKLLETAGIENNLKNFSDLKNIIKSYATYSLNMPLSLKLKKTFPNLSGDKLKELNDRIKKIASEYDLEEAILHQRMSKFFTNEFIKEKYGVNVRNREFLFRDDYFHFIQDYFKNKNPDSFLLSPEFYNLKKEINYLFSSNFHYIKDYRLDFYNNKDVFPAKMYTQDFYIFLNTLKNYPNILKEVTYDFNINNVVVNDIKYPEYKEFVEMVKMLRLNNEEKAKEKIENILKKSETFLIENLNLKETINFLAFRDIIEEINSNLELEKSEFYNFVYVDYRVNGFFFHIKAMLNRHILLSSLKEPTEIGRKIVSYMYNFYSEFLAKELKGSSYIVNPSFLKTLNKLALEFGIQRDENLIAKFKEKYLPVLEQKINNIEKNLITSKAIDTKNKDFFYMNIPLSQFKVNRTDIDSINEYFDFNAKILNIPSYESLVELGRKFSEEKINEKVKELLDNIRENIQHINFLEEISDLQNKKEFKNINFKESSRRLVFLNFDYLKDLLVKAIKNYQIRLGEYSLNDLEELSKAIDDTEYKIVKNALNIEDIDSNIKQFALYFPLTGDREKDYISAMQRKLNSVISIYPETEDLKNLHKVFEKFLKEEIDSKKLKKEIDSLFLIENSNSLGESISLMINALKISTKSAEVRFGLEAEKILKEMPFINQDLSSFIKDEKLKEALLTGNLEILDKDMRKKAENFLFKGDLKSLADILGIDASNIDYQILSLTENRAIANTFKVLMVTAKNKMRSDDVTNKEEILNLLKEHEKKFYSASIEVTIDRDFMINLLQVKGEKLKDIYSELRVKAIELFDKEITISTDETEKLLRKLLIEREPLTTKETLKLYMFNEVFSKILLLQGTHDLIKSNNTFNFFLIKDDALRSIMTNYNQRLIDGISFGMLFSDLEYNDEKVRGTLEYYFKRNLFKRNIFALKMTNEYDYKVPRRVEEKITTFDVYQNINHLVENKSPEHKMKEMLIDNPYVLREYTEEEQIKNLFNGKNIDELNKEEIRNYLNDVLWIDNTENSMEYLIYKNKELLEDYLYIVQKAKEQFKKLKENFEVFFRVVKDNYRLNEYLRGNELEEIIKEKTIFEHKIANNKIDFIEEEIKNFNLGNLLEELKNLEAKKKEIEEKLSFAGIKEIKIVKEILNSIEDNITNIQKNIENFSGNINLFMENKEQINKEIKKNIENKRKEINQKLSDSLNNVVLLLDDFSNKIRDLKKSIDASVSNLEGIKKALIKEYVKRVEKEFDYKDILFLRNRMADLNYTFTYIFPKKDDFSLKEKENANLNSFLFTQLMNSSNDKIKKIMTIYFADQFYRTIANFGEIVDKRILFYVKSKDDFEKGRVYINIGSLVSEDEIRNKDLIIYPERINQKFFNHNLFSRETIMYNFYGDHYVIPVTMFKDKDSIYDGIYSPSVFNNKKEFLDIKQLKNALNDFSAFADFIVSASKDKSVSLSISADKETYKNNYFNVVLNKSGGKKKYFRIHYQKNRRLNFLSNVHELEYEDDGGYIGSLGRHLRNIFSKIGEGYGTKETRRIRVRSLYDLNEEDKNLINVLNAILPFYKTFDFQLNKLIKELEHSPDKYKEYVKEIQESFNNALKNETIRLEKYKKSVINTMNMLKENKDKYPLSLLKKYKENIQKAKNQFLNLKTENIAKFFIGVEKVMDINNSSFIVKENKKHEKIYMDLRRITGRPLYLMIQNTSKIVSLVKDKEPTKLMFETIFNNKNNFIFTTEQLKTSQGMLSSIEEPLYKENVIRKGLDYNDIKKEFKKIILAKNDIFNIAPNVSKTIEKYEETIINKNIPNKEAEVNRD